MKQDFLQEIKKIRDYNERAMLKHLSDFQDLLYDPLEKYSKVEAEKTELESEFDQLRSSHQTKVIVSFVLSWLISPCVCLDRWNKSGKIVNKLFKKKRRKPVLLMPNWRHFGQSWKNYEKM